MRNNNRVNAAGCAVLTALACAIVLGGCGGGSGGADSTAASTQAATSTSGTATPTAQRSDTQFSFTLPSARTTSAGVYTRDGTLLRTLWRGEHLAAGSYSRSWDLLDDHGNPVADGDYVVKLIHHDLQYVWEGVIGNTSDRSGGALPHRSLLGPSALAAAPGRMFYAVGYNEAQSAINGFALATPQRNQSPVHLQDPFVGAGLIASDGKTLYWADTGGLAKQSFVAAFDIASGTAQPFAEGQSLCLNPKSGGACWPAQSYSGVIESRATLDNPPTGLAVQASGSLLAVAYAGDGVVRLFDKTRGHLLQALPAPGNRAIAFAPNGDLWVLGAAGAQRYTALDSTPTVAATLGPLTQALAITVDPNNDDAVWVAEGGNRQQLRRFDHNGQPLAVIGQHGGCTVSTAVADDRLCFTAAAGREQTALAVDETHVLWVVDSANNRLLGFAPDGGLVTTIAYQPAVYVSATDPGNPTRVFSNHLEFAVDYTKDLSSPGAWTLVRNWLSAVPAALRDANSVNAAWGGFRSVQTLANGHTYGVLQANGKPWLLELTAAGSLRSIGALRSAGSGETAPVLYENGDLGWATSDGRTQTVLRLALQGFDADANPVWAANPLALAAAPMSVGSPWYRNGTFSGVNGPRFPLTASGMVVFFDPSVDAASGMHLGAVAQGAASWLWQASPSAPLDGRGSFQTKKDDASIQYGGNTVMALGRSIVYGYHGEFYTDLGNHRSGQANQFMHFHDDGLFVGQFGVPSTRASGAADPGLSGNAFSPTLVRAAGRTYLYHNDESTQGGVHRWRLDGIDDIQELSGSGALRSAITLR